MWGEKALLCGFVLGSHAGLNQRQALGGLGKGGQMPFPYLGVLGTE